MNVSPRASTRLIIALAFVAAASTQAGSASTDADAEAQVAAILSLPADADYGAYLAGDCAACHRLSGGSDGIPPIAGLPGDYLVRALVEYRSGLRDNEVMTVRAARLGDEEIAALAAHFAAQTP